MGLVGHRWATPLKSSQGLQGLSKGFQRCLERYFKFGRFLYLRLGLFHVRLVSVANGKLAYGKLA